MQAHRLLLKTNAQGKLEGLPDFAPNQYLEIIVLFNEVPVSESPQIYRKPPAELAGKVKILGDIISRTVEEM
ncbi:MAG TPA: hypothetical protein VIF37_19030 [Methylobacter sp.]|jgi:hypothetical protein